jgi:FkbM family methyltransferase
MNLRQTIRRRPHWVLWHPHQKLWNWSLVEAIAGKNDRSRLQEAILDVLVFFDSLILLVGVSYRRTRAGGWHTSPPTSSPGQRPAVLYIDCGVHKRGEQIRWMDTWFSKRYDIRTLAFEANSAHYKEALSSLSDLANVDLRQVALVGPEYGEPEVRLYLDGREGKGDSLFSSRGHRFEVVRAQRLSELLAEEHAQLKEVPVILRMNIEGSELYVIEDLVASGIAHDVDGYYGMWDDLSKIDLQLDRRFRTMLREQGIKTVTFNDRDLPFAVRRLAIRLDLDTKIRQALRRKSPASAGGDD